MKMKRFISAIAALTMSVSCFAGLTITGHAAAGETTNIANITFTAANGQFITAAKSTIEGAYTSGLVTVSAGGKAEEQEEAKRVSSAENGWAKLAATASSKGVVSNYGLIEGIVVDLTRATNYATIGDNDKVTVEFDMAYGNLTGKGQTHQLLDADGAVMTQYTKNSYASNVSNDDLQIGLMSNNRHNTGNASTIAENANHIHFKYEIDYAKNSEITVTATEYTGTTPGTPVVKTGYPQSGKGKKLAKINIPAGHNNPSRFCAVRNITVTRTEGEALTLIPYSISYQADGTEIAKDSDSVVANTEVDAKTTKIVGSDGKKYQVKTTDPAQTTHFTITEESNYTVQVEEMPKYTFTLNAVLGTGDNKKNKTIGEVQQMYEGDSYTYGYPRYIQDPDDTKTYYEIPAASGTYWGGSYTMDTENHTVDLNYTNVYNNVIAMIDYDGGNGDNADGRTSNRNASRPTALDEDIPLSPGTYTFVVRGYARGSCTSLIIDYGNDETQTIVTHGTDLAGSWGEKTVPDVKVTKPGTVKLVLNEGATSSDYTDTIFIYGDPLPPEESTVTQEPWQAFVAPTGQVSGKTFESLTTGAGLTTKTLSVTVYDDTVPQLSVNGGEYANPGWTAYDDTANGKKIYYVQFMAAEDGFANFGAVKAKVGETELTLTLVEEASSGD